MIRAVVARTLAVLLVAAAWSPRPVRADAVVGPENCPEAALDAALAGGGKITFNCGSSPFTITVTSQKTIAVDTSIDGGGLITLSGGGKTQVFVNSGATLTLANLIIANGVAYANGGAVYNGGTLAVTNSTFSGNVSATEYVGGGGAICNGGTLTVTNSTFSGNIANSSYNGGSEGGAILNNGGTLTVTNSTFSGNSANGGDGGGIYINSGTATVTNSTFSGNSALAVYPGGGYGGAIYNGGTLTVTNSTFSGNSGNSPSGAAINNSGARSLKLTNTIVANSPIGGNCGGIITDGGHNLDSGTTCGFSAVGSLSNTDPLLDPAGLANNGGPTQTIALCTGTGAPRAGCTGASPAINAGDESVCSTTTGTAPVDNLDQRGFTRPGFGATNCSIGAYEFDSPGPPAGTSDCCQCPTSCAVPVNGSCGACIVVFSAACEGGQLCVLHTPTPSPTPTATKPSPTPSPTATNTPGTSDCCQCAGFCAAPIVGTCGGCAIVFGASCAGGSCITQTPTPTNTPTVTPTPVACAGDCDGSRVVTVDEILTMVNIALGNADATACPNGIPSGAQVDVALILTAVNNALNGCSAP